MKKDGYISCKIVNGVISSTTVYKDEDFRVILDLSPVLPDHTLILPKEHFDNVCQLGEVVTQKVLPLAARIGGAMKEALHCDGLNLVQSSGEAAKQTVEHFRMHVVPGYKNSGKKIVAWDPGEATQEEGEAQGDTIRRALKQKRGNTVRQDRDELLRAMYEGYQGTLRRATKNCGIPDSYVDDIVQETFVAYFSHYSLE